jgi:microcystin-dependent protein
MTRAVAITLAGRAGEEYHTLVIGEAPSHSHTVNSHSHGGATGGQSASHTHGPTNGGRFVTWGSAGATGTDPGAASGSTWAIGDAFNAATGGASVDHYHGIPAESPGTNAQGGGASHENVPPTVFIPYIVKLDN